MSPTYAIIAHFLCRQGYDPNHFQYRRAALMSGSLCIKWSQRGGNNIHVQGIDDVQQTSHINERVPCLRVCEPKGGSVVVVVSRLSAMIAHIARDEFWDPSSYVFKKSFSNLKPNMSASSKTTLPFSN